MEALSWFKFCPAKWNMGKTKKLSMEDKAEYLDLCSSYWVGGCVMSADEMREHSDCIDTFIRRGLVSDDGIEWLNAQYEEATRKSTAASKAAKTRWDKKQQCERNANAMHPHSERNASVMQRREEREEKKEREDRERDKRATAPAPELELTDTEEYQPSNAPLQDEEKEKVAPKTKRFVAPTEIEAQAFFQTTESPDSWQQFFDYYTSNGWRVGKNPMKDWHAAARKWVRTENQYQTQKPNNTKPNGKPFADLTPESFINSVKDHVAKKQRDRANSQR